MREEVEVLEHHADVRRISSMRLRSFVSSMPSTMIRPFWCSSRRLMQRIIVDLPEPEGPQITMLGAAIMRG